MARSEELEREPGAQLRLDARGIVIELDAAAAALLGVSREQAIGKPLADLVGSEERADSERDRLRLAELVRGTQDAVFSKDLQGVVTTWNPAAERLYGYSAEEAIGSHVSFLIPTDRKQRGAARSSTGCAGANASRPTRPSGSARTARGSTSR